MKDEEPDIYRKCMEKARDRIAAVRWLYDAKPLGGHSMLVEELVFVQLRKILELIAFSSLTANKEKYAAAHEKFATHWKAKAMLDSIEELNPHSIPFPCSRWRPAETLDE